MNSNLSYTMFNTRWGYFGFCSTETGLVRTCLPTKTGEAVKRYILGDIEAPVFVKSLLPDLQQKIIAYYEGNIVDFSHTPVDLNKFSPFSQKVLMACMKIKYGQTKTYRQLAALAGSPEAARAAGGIMARNPNPLIIPCHRVLAANGSLCGFSAPGGLETKKRMLTLESKRS